MVCFYPNAGITVAKGVRKLKVKQKISGTFRSDVGADAFFTIHTFHCRYSMEEQPITT